MKKGEVVKISENNNYPGQTMAWTEEYTGQKLLKKGTKLLHTSSKKLNGFYKKETCFYTDNRGTGHIFVIELLRDTIVENYGYEEVRFTISKENIKIRYIGFRGQSKKTNFKYKDFTDKKYLLGLE